jgi:hypothetical protein
MKTALILITILVITSFNLFSGQEIQLRKTKIILEVITDNAVAGGDGGNQWGGHQCRIVKTAVGVFTAYTSGAEDHFQRRWHLMHRTESGWQELATGKSGREPVNLMAGPDGSLYIIGWPQYQGTLWSGKPQDGVIDFKKEQIVAVYTGSHPYNSAGIDSDGNICVLSSVEDYDNMARFQWAYFNASRQEWIGRITFLDYRHCYTYIFPHPNRSVSLVSTRDVRWQTLGYTQPPNTFDYVFNAFRYWTIANINQPLQELALIEELPTAEYLKVDCRAMNDVYIDTKEQLHVLYMRRGKSTSGRFKRYHAVYLNDGTVSYEGEMTYGSGHYCRIFQDKHQRYFILDDNGILYLLNEDSFTPKDAVELDLNDYQVNYSGFGLSVPRTGTKLSNTMHVVYPSREGKYYMYFQLKMEDLFALK